MLLEDGLPPVDALRRDDGADGADCRRGADDGRDGRLSVFPAIDCGCVCGCGCGFASGCLTPSGTVAFVPLLCSSAVVLDVPLGDW